jgi:hypothetical protein
MKRETAITLLTILSVVCTVIGVPWSFFVLFASGMVAGGAACGFGSHPQDLQVTLPLPVLAIIFAIVSWALCLISKPRQVLPALISLGMIVLSSLAIAAVIEAYNYTRSFIER